MKIITPMTRLKDIMNVIKTKLDIKDCFHIFELNQKESKERYCGCYEHIKNY